MITQCPSASFKLPKEPTKRVGFLIPTSRSDISSINFSPKDVIIIIIIIIIHYCHLTYISIFLYLLLFLFSYWGGGGGFYVPHCVYTTGMSCFNVC